MFPGLDEVFSLSDIKTHAASGRLGRARRRLRADRRDDPLPVAARHPRLVHGPAVPRQPARQQGRRLPCSSGSRRLPVADDNVFAAGRRFYDRLDGVRELLDRSGVTNVRLVVNPERMVIAEARRTYTYLSLFGYRVDAVVANRLLPAEHHRPVVRAVARAARRASRDDRGELRAAAGAAGRARGRRARRASIGSASSARSCTANAMRPRRCTPASRSRSLEARGDVPPDAGAAVRRARRPRGRPPRRRAARPGRPVPAGAPAARFAPAADDHRRDRFDRAD